MPMPLWPFKCPVGWLSGSDIAASEWPCLFLWELLSNAELCFPRIANPKSACRAMGRIENPVIYKMQQHGGASEIEYWTQNSKSHETTHSTVAFSKAQKNQQKETIYCLVRQAHVIKPYSIRGRKRTKFKTMVSERRVEERWGRTPGVCKGFGQILVLRLGGGFVGIRGMTVPNSDKVPHILLYVSNTM